MTNIAKPTELLPCGKCGSPCRVEAFGPSDHIETPVMLWLCSRHPRFGGECPSDLAYFTPEAWNEASAPQEPDDALIEVQAETYRQMHEIARELGYPSILEALEALSRLKTQEPVADDDALIERIHELIENELFPIFGVGPYEALAHKIATLIVIDRLQSKAPEERQCAHCDTKDGHASDCPTTPKTEPK